MWIDIPFLCILNYIVADHGGSKDKTAEKDPVSRIMDVVVLNQNIGGRLIGIYGIGIRTPGFYSGLVDFIPLYGYSIRVVHLYAARPGFLGYISLHNGALHAGQIDGVAGIVGIFLA